MSPRCGARTCTCEPRSPARPLDDGIHVGRQHQHGDLAEDAVAGLPAVDLLQQVLDDLGHRLGVLLGDPAPLAADPTTPDVEHLRRCLEVIVGEGEDVGVGAVAEDHRGLLQRAVQRPDVVAQPRGLLELEVGGRVLHPALEPPDELAGVACHEVLKSSAIARCSSG